MDLACSLHSSVGLHYTVGRRRMVRKPYGQYRAVERGQVWGRRAPAGGVG